MAALFRQGSRFGWLFRSRIRLPCSHLRGHHSDAKETTPPQISIGQTWHNELGSTMVITSFDLETGVFGGTYQSLVGEVTPKKQYVLTGRKDLEGYTTGWTVNWQNPYLNAHSVTTWSGQYQFTPSGDPVILTTWLLTCQTTPDKDWESTLVGFDYFTQTPPSQETIDRAKLQCRKSHPKEA